jgi:hypothetical protein
MAALTCRRNQDRNRESWRILYGDIEVGWIGQRSGVPKDAEQWGWHCGFFPLSQRGVRAHGVAPSFEKARNAFEAAWADILPRCRNTDFDEHRFERAHLAWKYKMWDTGCRMPTQAAADRSRCFCGVEITTASISDHIRARHMDAG